MSKEDYCSFCSAKSNFSTAATNQDLQSTKIQNKRNKTIKVFENSKQLVSKRVVAEVLGVSSRTVEGWRYKNLIPSHKVNGSVRYDLKEIERWILQQQEKKP